MTIRRPLTLALGLSLGLGALPAPAPAAETDADEALRLIQSAIVHYGLFAIRTQVDMTYDSVTIDRRTGDAVVNGLEFYPALPWTQGTPCVVGIERVAIVDTGLDASLETVMEISGVTVPAECVEPQQAAMFEGFGYETLVVNAASIRVGYDLPSAEAELEVNASIADAGELNLTAFFDYLSVRTGDLEALEAGEMSPEMGPVARLHSAELSFDNRGVWERVKPFLESQFEGDLSVVPLMVSEMMRQALADPATGPSPEVNALADNVSGEIARFLNAQDRVVIIAEPEGGVLLREELFDDPAAMIAAFQPRVAAVSGTRASILAPEQLSAALGGGGGLDDAGRLAAGRALITGVGAPKAPAEGRALLAPLAQAGNPAAAALVAEAMAAAGETRAAYAMALRAAAGGAPGAIGLVDTLEGQLGVGDLLAAQSEVMSGWSGNGAWGESIAAAQASGDVLGLRSLAFDASVGHEMPRNYPEAYFLASLAAAAGDRGAAALRDRLDARFTDDAGAAEPAWSSASGTAASRALAAWTDGGLAARLTAQ